MKRAIFGVFVVVLLGISINAYAITVLVTGFEPWDRFDVNHSYSIAETLDGQEIGGATIVGIELPVDFEDSVEVITQAIEDFDPVIVISIGINPNARLIAVERIGSNLKYDYLDEDARPDFNDYNGPLFRFSTLPIRHIIREMRKAKIPVRQCFNAGTYVCNAVLYGTLGHIIENKLPVKTGFIHVPPVLSQDEEKGLELETMIDAVKIAIQVSLLDVYFDKIYVDKLTHVDGSKQMN